MENGWSRDYWIYIISNYILRIKQKTMAAKKKTTTVQELQELIEATPKANILTNEQLQTLKNISSDLADIRRALDGLKGEENISDIMFEVGKSYHIADKCENELDSLLESYEDNCYDCDENY